MDRYCPPTNRRRVLRQGQTLNAIVDFRYLAPAKLAREEAHEQMLSRLAPLLVEMDRHHLASYSS